MQFEVKKSSLGPGYDVVFEGKSLWFKMADSPLRAAVAGIQYISNNGGPPPSELVKALQDESLRKSILEFVTETMRKVQEPQEPPLTRKEAMVFLEDAIKKSENAREAYEKGTFYTRISRMETEAEFQEHPGYHRLVAEVRQSRGK